MNIDELNSKIRKVKLAMMNNLTQDFTPINAVLDEYLENELKVLYSVRKNMQQHKIDTLSDMYLRLYA